MSAGQTPEAAGTLPALLEAHAVARPRGVAIRVKRLGIWREVDWRTYADAVRDAALGFDESGVAPGERVVIFAANDPRWLVADLAVQTVRGVSVGLQAVQDVDELVANLVAAAPGLIVCSDQERVDNVLAVRERIPAFRKLVVFDMEGLHTPEYHDEPIVSFEDFRAAGRARHAELPARHAELLAAVSPDDPSTVSFTAGTTGHPRGVVLTQRGQVAMGRLLAGRVGATVEDRGYSLLPLGHANARAFDVALPLVAGSSLNFAESPDTIESDLAELAPTLLVATPRFFERIRGSVEVRAGRAARTKRTAYRFALRRLAAALEARRAGRGGGLSLAVGHALIGRWVLGKAGLLRLRFAGVVGSAAPAGLVDWFWQLNVPLHELYGQVEAGGIAFSQRGLQDAGTAGPPLGPEVEARIAPDGELLLRTPGLLVGRLEDGAASGLVDGWYPTGDLAALDDQGRLIPKGRRSELLVTAAGAEVSATEVETAIERSPYVSTAVAVADGRPFVTVLVELHVEAVAEWAKGRDKAVTTYAALAADADVRRLIADEVASAGAALPEPARAREVLVTPRPFDDELTATGTIRRTVVLSRYAADLEALYAGPVAP